MFPSVALSHTMEALSIWYLWYRAGSRFIFHMDELLMDELLSNISKIPWFDENEVDSTISTL